MNLYGEESVSYSIQRAVSDGSLNRVAVSLAYLDRSDISVWVDDIQIPETGASQYAWHWDGDDIVFDSPIPNGIEVLVRRSTNRSSVTNVFSGRAEFSNKTMDENFTQMLYLAQEYSEGSGLRDVFSDINMHGYKITNTGFATEDDDVVTLKQYREDAEGAKVARDEARTAQKAAEAAKSRAEAAATAAEGSVEDVESAKEGALTAITDAVGSLNQTSENTIEAVNTAASTAVSKVTTTAQSTINSINQTSSDAIANINSATDTVKLEVARAKNVLEENKQVSAEIQQTADDFTAIATPVLEASDVIKTVADNIQHVITDSNNIDSIKVISADLEGSFETGGVIDYGNLDIPDSGSAIITGGNIYIVAQNIDAVKKVAEGIDNLPSAGGLSNYYTKEETDAKIAEAVADIPAGGSNDAYDIVYGDTTVGAVLDDLLYVPISITSFTSNVGNQEKGSVVNNVTLSWNYNKVPQTLTLNGAPLDVATKSKALTGQNIKTNTTWTLKATDARGAVSQKSVAISFLNGVYYGVGTVTDTAGVTNEFVQGLTKVLASSRNRRFSANAGKGQYIYYAIPVAMGTPTFYVGGFEGGFELLHTFLYTNSKGYSENYNVYKSINSSLGSTSVEVR